MLRNMKVTIIPITVGTLETFLNNLEKKFDKQEISGRIETIQTTALLKSAWIL